MSARLADLLAEQCHLVSAAAVRAGHRDLAGAVEAESLRRYGGAS